MKKLTAGIFAAILTVVGTNAADAAIASKGYVDDQVKGAADITTFDSTKTDYKAGTVGKAISDLSSAVDKAATDNASAYVDVKGDTMTGNLKMNNGITDTVTIGTDGNINATGTVKGTLVDAGTLKLGDVDVTATATELNLLHEKTVADTYDADTASATQLATTAAVKGAISDVEANANNKLDKTEGGTVTGAVIFDGGTTTTNLTATGTTSLQGTSVTGTLTVNEQEVKSLAFQDTVAAADIDKDAVTTDKIMDANVTEAKLAAEVVTKLNAGNSALQKGDATAGQFVTLNAAGTALTGAGEIGALAHKNTVSTALIDNKAVTTDKLSNDVQDQLAWILNNPGECEKSGWKCALTFGNVNGTPKLEWEVIERGTEDTNYNDGNGGAPVTSPSVPAQPQQ